MPQLNLSEAQKKLNALKEEGYLAEDKNGQLRPVKEHYDALLQKVASDPELAPYVQAIRNTRYDMSIFLKLEGRYSHSIYAFLKQHEIKGSVSVEFDALLPLLGVNKLDFKVIERAQTELKEKADISFEHTIEDEKIIFTIYHQDT